MKNQVSVLAAIFAFTHSSLGQTSTDCNPLNNSTCSSDSALGNTITIDFTQGESSLFTLDSGTDITYGENGAEFTITSDGLARTIVSKSYIFFGKVDIALKAANGTGIVSSFVMESDDLDEIDLEWLGGNKTVVETNYFGKGNTTSYDRATYVTVDDPQDIWHIYTVDWTQDYIKWYVNGNLIRTLLYADALNGKNFPQTPMQIKIGNWVGGGADEATGTVEWAGGYTDLNDAPFTMYVKNITIQDYTTCATAYSYGDKTGSYGSIILSDNGTSVTNGSCSESTTNRLGGSNSTGTTSSNDSSSASSSASSTSSGTASTSSSLQSSTSVSNNGAAALPNTVGFMMAVVGLWCGSLFL